MTMGIRGLIRRFPPLIRLGAVLLLLAMAGPAIAQEEPGEGENPLDEARRRIENAVQRIAIPRSRLTDGPHVRAAFREVVAKPSHSTVRVRSGGRDVAVGGIVGPDGWILTKAPQRAHQRSATGRAKIRRQARRARRRVRPRDAQDRRRRLADPRTRIPGSTRGRPVDRNHRGGIPWP